MDEELDEQGELRLEDDELWIHKLFAHLRRSSPGSPSLATRVGAALKALEEDDRYRAPPADGVVRAMLSHTLNIATRLLRQLRPPKD